MNTELLEQIQQVLGWKPQAALEGSITDLNAFPQPLIEAARLLPPVLRHSFVSFYSSAENIKFVPGFVEDVIENEQDVSGWRRGRILVPDFTPRSLVQLEGEEILALLLPLAAEEWHQLKPQRDLWEAGEFLTGAPAVVLPELDYRYFPPEHVRDLLVSDTELNPVADVTVATRRWTASNLAGVATKRNLLGVGGPRELIRACFPDLDRIGTNGLIAAQALIKELTTLGESDSEVPGFRGPDDWYKAELDLQ
jgi:hypothetical protein